MTTFTSGNHIGNQFMNDYILRKYKQNIDKFADSVKIYPKDYKRKSNFNKPWFIYFKYYVGKNRRNYKIKSYSSHNQKININEIKDHKTKIRAAQFLKELTINTLKTEPVFVLKLVYGLEEAKRLYPSVFMEEIRETSYISIKEALDNALEVKKSSIKDSFYSDMKSIKDRFIKYIGANAQDNIELLNKKMIVDFLDSIKKSNRTYNNNKSNFSALLSQLKRDELISENWLFDVGNLKTTPTLNKAFTKQEVKEILEYAKKNDINLYYFLIHIYYGLMRPITVVRLKVKDVDLENKVFNTDTKTGGFIKLVTSKLYDEFYSKVNLKEHPGNSYIFNGKKLFIESDSKDENRRSNICKRFKPIKNKFGFGYEYTITSFRHASIRDVFEERFLELKSENTPNPIEKSIEFIRQITEHTTNAQTLQYLRGITNVVHVDWSSYLE